ncbi:MAG: DNA-binding protein [Elainella sp. C42_A2020_010]|nr:DNA-binding protein [Elainella sp. C42_A2020_010]RNJ67219.1 MAG: DNA-binding protein [Leptolyngbya sp. IPPAS B-1204]
MKPILTTVLTSTLVAMTLPVAEAQIPIRDLQRNPGTSISGEIRSVVGNEFILDDGTGQIIVDAGPRWYHQLSLEPGEQVTVVGEYDDYDFDAFRITRSNGEVIQIREGSGPPPWAGGRRRLAR